jgi:hypothetical protein
VEKESSNFCDFFQAGGKRDSKEKMADLLSAAESLFKKTE